MSITQFVTRVARIGLASLIFLTMTLACASQGDAPDNSDTTVMNAVADNADADSGSEAMAKTEDKSDRLICRRIKPTGSRFGERVCMRQAQWEKYSGQGRRDLETMQRTKTNPGNAPDGG